MSDKGGEGFIPFGDPNKYKEMSPKEKEELTQKMYESHRGWIEKHKVKDKEDIDG